MEERNNILPKELESFLEDGDFQSALTYIKNIESQANNDNSLELKIETHFYYGIFYEKQNQAKKAEYAFQKGILLAEKESQYNHIIKGYQKLGKLLMENHHYKEGIENLEKALSKAEEVKELEHRNQILLDLAYSLVFRSEREQAKEYYERAMKIGKDEKNDFMMMKGLSGMSKIYFSIQDTEKALEFLKKAEEYAIILNDKEELQTLKTNQAGIFAQYFRYQEALEQYESVLSYWENSKNKRAYIIILVNMALLKNNLGQIEQGIAHLKAALEEAELIDDRYLLESIYFISGTFYSETEQFKNAVEQFDLALEVNKKTQVLSSKIDSLFSKANALCFLKEWKTAEVVFEEAYRLGFTESEPKYKIYGLVGKGCILAYNGKLNEGLSLINQALGISEDKKYINALAIMAELAGFTMKQLGKDEESTHYYRVGMEYYNMAKLNYGVDRCKKYLN